MDKTALVFGSSGLVGSELTKQLLTDDRYKIIKIFVRKSLLPGNPKIVQIIDPLVDTEKISAEIIGNDFFCCLGTTIKKAGSKKFFEWVDLELPVRIAQIAARNKVEKFLVVSSIGANANSGNFYLRTKGTMEKKVMENHFEHIYILRPSMLLGKRNEFRFLEVMGKVFMNLLSVLMLGPIRKYRGIQASRVAKAMIKLANSSYKDVVIESDKIEELGR